MPKLIFGGDLDFLKVLSNNFGIELHKKRRDCYSSVLIDQNYVAIVVILITFNSNTITDILVFLEYVFPEKA